MQFPEDEPELPDEPELQLIQTSFAKGHLQHASRGRVDSAVYLLLFARDCMRANRPLPPELANYLASAFNDIALGADANSALNLRPGRTGRPKCNRRDYLIAQRMVEIIDKTGASQNAAASIIAEQNAVNGGPTDIKKLKSIYRQHSAAARIYRSRSVNRGQ